MPDKCFLFLGGISITRTPSNLPIAGESYTLDCSAGGSRGTFQWLGPPDGRTPVDDSGSDLNIVSTATSSQLQFRPIGQSDNGSYSCSANVGGLTLLSEPTMITVNGTITPDIHYVVIMMIFFQFPAPSVTVQINGGSTQQLEMIISSPVMYLELKISISILSQPPGGLKTMVPLKLQLEPTHPLSPSSHCDCLMFLDMTVKLPLVQATSQEIL